MMNPQRIGLKFFATPETEPERDLSPFIGLFHRFIQNRNVEGLLIDVADYGHVPDGPGIILIGHDVDYAIDLCAGRAGLLVTCKRCGDRSPEDVIREGLRRAAIAIRAIESDATTGFEFATDELEIRFIDRLAAPNGDAAVATLRGAIEPVLAEAFGAEPGTLDRASLDDTRQTLTFNFRANAAVDTSTIIDQLGGSTLDEPGETEISVEELKKLRDENAQLLLIDVREPHEYAERNIGGKLIPLQQLGEKLEELDQDAEIIVHCRSGERSARAVLAMRESGFKHVRNLKGGLLAWIDRIDPTL